MREHGRIANAATGLDRLLRKLGGDGMKLRFCYEAGPCGYGIHRRLTARGHECVVVAPSPIPKRAGDRVKTDGRDVASLAKLHRAGELPRCGFRMSNTSRCVIWYGAARSDPRIRV